MISFLRGVRSSTTSRERQLCSCVQYGSNRVTDADREGYSSKLKGTVRCTILNSFHAKLRGLRHFELFTDKRVVAHITWRKNRNWRFARALLGLALYHDMLRPTTKKRTQYHTLSGEWRLDRTPPVSCSPTSVLFEMPHAKKPHQRRYSRYRKCLEDLQKRPEWEAWWQVEIAF